MEINGKIYRNLEGQVEYLTGKWDDLQDQINDVRAHLTHYVIVDALPVDPEDIDPSAVYLVGPKGTAPDTYYEEWVYVQKADESWMWEKLGDTASIDLSVYLEKDTSTTPYAKAYIKKADGTQDTVSMTSSDPTQGFVAQWGAGGRMATKDPVNSSDAVNKSYGDSNYLAKQSGSTPYDQAYGKNTSGSQIMWNVDPNGGNSTLALRLADGRLKTGADPTEWNDVLIKHYSDTYLLAKQTGTTSFRQAYAKGTDGSQYMQVINGKDMDAGVDRIAAYGTDGRLRVGEPVNAKDAATKGYVDAAVGQLLYLHRIYLVITVDASNYLLVRAHLINGSPTALTSLGRPDFARLEVDYGCYGPDSNISNVSNNTTCAVTKMAESFRFNDMTEGYWGFLYQYMSGGSLVSDFVGYGSTMTLTDTVINF